MENRTVNVVAVEAVISPIAPLLNWIELFAATGSKPNPLIVMPDALASNAAVLLVTTGTIFATWTAGPLDTLLEVTTAVKMPALAGLVDRVTVSEVAVAAVTVPTAPLLNTTLLLAAVKSKP